METTESASVGNEIIADTALIGSMLSLTIKSTVKVFPTFVVTDDGEIVRFAA
jgi:hypothetical protein